MTKRQAVAPTATGKIPHDLIAFRKEVSDVYDDFTVLLPTQTGSLTMTGNTPQKIKMELPNTKSLRLNQIMLECTLVPSFTSTDGADTYATVLPKFVPLIPSILNRFTIFVGSNTFCDVMGNDLRWNLQYWTKSNAINRNKDLYLYPTTPVGPATANTPTTVRFPLVWDDCDFPNLKTGFFPTGILGKTIIDLYFNAPALCMYYTGTPAGTITLSYTVSDIKFKVEDMTSDLIASALASKSLNFSYQEWYYQPVTLTPSSQTIQVQLDNSFRYVNAVVAVIRKTSDTTDLKNGNKLKYYSSDVNEITSANIRMNGQLRYPEPLSSSIDLMHEIKKVLPNTQMCDYFQNVTTNATTNCIFAFRIGRSISEGVETGVNCSSWTAPVQIEITFGSALSSANSTMDCFILHDRFVTITERGFQIDE